MLLAGRLGTAHSMLHMRAFSNVGKTYNAMSRYEPGHGQWCELETVEHAAVNSTYLLDTSLLHGIEVCPNWLHCAI